MNKNEIIKLIADVIDGSAIRLLITFADASAKARSRASQRSVEKSVIFIHRGRVHLRVSQFFLFCGLFVGENC